MAESKFLQYQDKTGNYLVDVCEDITDVPEAINCPTCKPDLCAVVPDWKSRDENTPFFNAKLCKYQVTIVTPLTTTNSPANATEEQALAALDSVFEQYGRKAAESLALGFNKSVTETAYNVILPSLENTKYYLDIRPNSRLKLSYSIEHSVIDQLPNAEPEDNNEPDEEEEISTSGGGGSAEYVANEVSSNLIIVRKALHLYERYRLVYVAVDNGNLIFEKSRKPFSLKKYGDRGIGKGSLLSRIIPDLDSFLNSKGYNILGVGKPTRRKKKVSKFSIKFGNNYKVTSVTVSIEGCGADQTKTFRGKNIKALRAKESFKDPTAMAYFSRLGEMVQDITAREPMPWLEFVLKYTYPSIFETFNYPINDKPPEETAKSAVVKALEQGGKQLGQDIFDEAFGLGDAIAYKFNKKLCNGSFDETHAENIRIGQVYDPDTDSTRNIFVAAQEQAFETLEDQEAVFSDLCKTILNMTGMDTDEAKEPEESEEEGTPAVTAPSDSAPKKNNAKEILFDFLGKIKLCGLTDLMLEVTNCLMGNLTLEESLSSILSSAMRAMSLESFGDFFILLPQEKKQELDALVKKKLESGDFFENESEFGRGQQVSNAIEDATTIRKPWTDPEDLKEEEKVRFGEQTITESEGRTLARQYDFQQSGKEELDSAVIMEAYFQAIIEIYADDLLQIVDILNKFPGAQIIARTLAIFDCPRAPILEPSAMDFLKDIELPFCRNISDITLPKLSNPFGWIPTKSDFTKILFDAMKLAIQEAIMRVIVKLMIKICNLFGSSLCQVAKTTGALIASPLSSVDDGGETTQDPLMGNRQQIADIIRDSIVGADPDAATVDNTVKEIFQLLGTGAVEFANEERLLEFAGDMSASSTRLELLNAFLGNPNEEFLDIIDSLIGFEYKEYREALPNKESIREFFVNMGNLFPPPVKDSMNDFVNSTPADDRLPANPSLCADPDEIENFCKLREDLLAGRATSEQSKKMCEDSRQDLKDDLEDLSCAMQSGMANTLMNALPTLMSAPGCDDGVVPYESPEAASVATGVLDKSLQQIKIAFSTDMLGNGGFLLGKNGWGMMNMILADTMGNPRTAHSRKSFYSKNYVDFYVDTSGMEDDEDYGKFGRINRQEGAYPAKVAEWLQYQFSDSGSDLLSELSFESNNDILESNTSTVSLNNVRGIDYIQLPDMGYNYSFNLDAQHDKVKITQKARKLTPDVTFKFADNAKGLRSGPASKDSSYSYGFNIEMFLSDIRPPLSGSTLHTNRQNDNVRVKITQLNNQKAKVYSSAAEFSEEEVDPIGSTNDTSGVINDMKFEFLAIDDTLDIIDNNWHTATKGLFGYYTKFADSFSGEQKYLPQIVLLTEMLTKEGASATKDSVKAIYDSFVSAALLKMISEVGENDAAFDYGAIFDDLAAGDLEYLVPTGYDDAGSLYAEGQITDSDGNKRHITNRDMILGVSRMQYETENGTREGPNRVHYLDPTISFGTYMNPGIYIMPVESKGWSGFVDVMFPELSPCKPQLTDLIDFDDIQDLMESKYSTTPEDDRLKGADECTVELPYDRILGRLDKIALEGVITAAIRIFTSIHFIKTIATFTKFEPNFPNVFSSLYANYIIENMEESFKDAQNDFFESFNTFKDEEFWYAFLEQCVQLYGRRVDQDDIINPPESVIRALNKLNDLQESYEYPDKGELRSKKDLGDVERIKTLKNYRIEKNLQFVAETEEHAKIILKEMVMEQLNHMSKKFIKNLDLVGMGPASGERYITNLDYYLLENFTQGSKLDLNKEIKEEMIDLPTEGEELYTNGGEFAVSEDRSDDMSFYKKGEEYIGYYHVSEDSDGNIMYMAGESHTSEPHDILVPFSDKISIPIGDVENYGFSASADASNPFVIEKYISINEIKYSPEEAISIIKESDSQLNISDIYPGDLDHVTEPSGRVVGLSGKLGVRYGLEFSFYIENSKIEITSVEVDALDLKIGQIQAFEGNSKLLLCLINLLTDDNKFKLVSHYILPLRKLTSVMAIYNDMAFLPSIGETTVADGYATGGSSNFDVKPGMGVEVVDGEITMTQNEGWASYKERDTLIAGAGWFNKKWDDWDQVLLRKSKNRIKKLFKTYYLRRDFKIGDLDLDLDPSMRWSGNLREALRPAQGDKLLPKWQKFRLKPNPFNSIGKLCDD